MYSDVHKLLLTYIISVRSTRRVQLQNKLDIILEEYQEEDDGRKKYPVEVASYITEINAKLRNYDFKIDEVKHQVSDETILVFTTTKQDDIIKQNTLFTAPELDTIKSIIEDIVENDLDFSVGLTNAVHKVASNTNRTARESNSFMTRLVDEGWLEVTKHDRVMLSPRSLSELKTYLVNSYGVNGEEEDGKIRLCHICRQIVTLGCLYEEKNFHYKCFDVFQRQNNKQGERFQQIGVDVDSVVVGGEN